MTDNSIGEMFKKLKDYIGIHVRCKYWLNEKLIESIIKFDRIDEYDFIFILDTYTWIFFLTYNQCIISIETIDGNILYENKFFEKEYKTINTEEELNQRKIKLYGEEYINKNKKIVKKLNKKD